MYNASVLLINSTGSEDRLGPAWLLAVSVTKKVSPQLRSEMEHVEDEEEQLRPLEVTATCSVAS